MISHGLRSFIEPLSAAILVSNQKPNEIPRYYSNYTGVPITTRLLCPSCPLLFSVRIAPTARISSIQFKQSFSLNCTSIVFSKSQSKIYGIFFPTSTNHVPGFLCSFYYFDEGLIFIYCHYLYFVDSFRKWYCRNQILIFIRAISGNMNWYKKLESWYMRYHFFLTASRLILLCSEFFDHYWKMVFIFLYYLYEQAWIQNYFQEMVVPFKEGACTTKWVLKGGGGCPIPISSLLWNPCPCSHNFFKNPITFSKCHFHKVKIPLNEKKIWHNILLSDAQYKYLYKTLDIFIQTVPNFGLVLQAWY